MPAYYLVYAVSAWSGNGKEKETAVLAKLQESPDRSLLVKGKPEEVPLREKPQHMYR